jgi:hypothetical protein
MYDLSSAWLCLWATSKESRAKSPFVNPPKAYTARASHVAQYPSIAGLMAGRQCHSGTAYARYNRQLSRPTQPNIRVNAEKWCMKAYCSPGDGSGTYERKCQQAVGTGYAQFRSPRCKIPRLVVDTQRNHALAECVARLVLSPLGGTPGGVADCRVAIFRRQEGSCSLSAPPREGSGDRTRDGGL